MKIAFLQKRFGTVGGAERFVFNLSRGLLDLGHEVTVFCGKHTSPRRQFPAALKIVHTPFNDANHRSEILSFTAACREMTDPALFDIVQTSDKLFFPVDVYRSGWGVHALYSRRDARGERGWLRRIMGSWRPIERLIRRQERLFITGANARRVVAISKKDAVQIEGFYRLPPGTVQVIYNGYDKALFNAEDRKTAREHIAQKYRIGNQKTALFVGNDFERKGLDHALTALGALTGDQRPVLLIAGKGNREKYVALARRLGIDKDVRFCGVQKNIAVYYRGADIFLFPSRFDAFANVCLEAAACGCVPLIGSGAGGAEIIRHGTDGFVLDDDTQTTARHILFLLAGNRQEQFSKRIARSALKYTIERCAKAYEALYRETLETPRK